MVRFRSTYKGRQCGNRPRRGSHPRALRLATKQNIRKQCDGAPISGKLEVRAVGQESCEFTTPLTRRQGQEKHSLLRDVAKKRPIDRFIRQDEERAEHQREIPLGEQFPGDRPFDAKRFEKAGYAIVRLYCTIVGSSGAICRRSHQKLHLAQFDR